MNALEPTQEGCLVRIPVELTVEEAKPHLDKAYKTTQKTIKLDGFRPGKVPVAVLKRRFARQIEMEAAEEAIKDILPKVLEEKEINPIALAPVEAMEFAEDGSLNFTAVVEVSPELDTYAWKGVKVERMKVDITEEDVDRHIESLRRDKALVSDGEEGDKAEKEDRLTVDAQRVDDAGLAVIGSKQEDMVFELGSGFFGEGSDEKLDGIALGETRRLTIANPGATEGGEDAAQPWDITLKKLEKVALPELDEDFAAQVKEDLDSVDALRAHVKDQLEQFARFQANQTSAGQLREAVLGAYEEMDLPPSLVNQTLEDMVKRQQEESGNAYPAETLRQYLLPMAVQELRWFFLRRALIDEEKLEVSDDEIMAHVENYQKNHPEQDLEQLKLMFKAGEQRDQLADEIIMGKVMDVLHQGVEWEDKPVSFMDLLAASQGGQQPQHHHHHHDHDHDHDHDHGNDHDH